MWNFVSLIVEATVGGHFLSNSFSRFKIHRTERFITQMNTRAQEIKKKHATAAEIFNYIYDFYLYGSVVNRVTECVIE